MYSAIICDKRAPYPTDGVGLRIDTAKLKVPYPPRTFAV